MAQLSDGLGTPLQAENERRGFPYHALVISKRSEINHVQMATSWKVLTVTFIFISMSGIVATAQNSLNVKLHGQQLSRSWHSASDLWNCDTPGISYLVKETQI